MLLTFLYVAILVTGCVLLLLLRMSNIQNRGTLALLGLGLILTQAPMLADWMRTAGFVG
jgi:hypothetical protein